MEGRWRKFSLLIEDVKKLTKPLQEDTEKIFKILKDYEEILKTEGAKPEECGELSQLSQSLNKLMDNLKNVREKETSKDIVIQFVGATSSGKSSLINALLGERRLPVGFMQTTMCSIKVCITEDSEWSIEKIDNNGNKEPLTEGSDEKSVSDLLSKMSGQRNEQEREKKGIGLRTIIQINWPASKCKKLPRNVILCDTPGFGENDEDMELVTQTCKKADIIVAVMDSMSPSRGRLTNLVKNVGCQFTFGVFTKWDECIRKAREEGQQSIRNVVKTANDYMKEFCEVLQGKGKAYFVNVKNFENHDDTFLQFENKLATSATKLKIESLTQQAKSVALHSRKVCEKLKTVIETRKREKLTCLETELALMVEDGVKLQDAFDGIKSKDEDLEILTDDTVQPLLKEVKDELLKGTSEEEAVKHFLDEINREIQKNLTQKRHITGTALQEWKKNMQFHKLQSLSTPPSKAPPQLTSRGLPEDQYQWYRDFNYYYTNNYICAALVGVAAVATPVFLAGAGVGALAGCAGEAVAQGVMTGGAWATTLGGPVGAVGGYIGEWFRGFRLGDQLKRKFPISQYKIDCWKSLLANQIRKLRQDCKKLLREEKDAALANILKKLESVALEKSDEIAGLCNKSHILNQLAAQLGNICDRVQTTTEEFDMLLAALPKAQDNTVGEIDPEIYISQADGTMHSERSG